VCTYYLLLLSLHVIKINALFHIYYSYPDVIFFLRLAFFQIQIIWYSTQYLAFYFQSKFSFALNNNALVFHRTFYGNSWPITFQLLPCFIERTNSKNEKEHVLSQKKKSCRHSIIPFFLSDKIQEYFVETSVIK
jgi:hypothetical protein